MGEVVAYANNKYQCFSQIKLENGERVLISIASAPTPSVKIMKLGFFGLWPVQTIWEYNPKMAGGYDAYVRKMVKMFQDNLAMEPKHPLDILRDRLLPCKSISEVRDSMFEAEHNLSEPVGKVATDRDPERPYLSGVLVRFDEGYSEAVSFFSQLHPSFRPPLPEGASESVRAGGAAYGLAISIAFDAMRSQGKLLLDGGEVSILEGAIGLSYAMFLFMLFSGYLKGDGVEVAPQPFANGFAEQFVYLDDAQRGELAKRGLELFQDMIGSGHQKIREWHDTLSKAVQLWLISATSDKRTKEHDEDLRKIFASQLGALYRAVE